MKPLDERQEKVIPLPPWQRSALRKSGRNALRDETVETRPPSGPLSGGITNDGPEYFHPNHPKGYFVHVMLNDLHAGGYRVTLPEMTVDGKTLTLAPMEFRRRVRLEWFVPLNC